MLVCHLSETAMEISLRRKMRAGKDWGEYLNRVPNEENESYALCEMPQTEEPVRNVVLSEVKKETERMKK